MIMKPPSTPNDVSSPVLSAKTLNIPAGTPNAPTGEGGLNSKAALAAAVAGVSPTGMSLNSSSVTRTSYESTSISYSSSSSSSYSSNAGVIGNLGTSPLKSAPAGYTDITTPLSGVNGATFDVPQTFNGETINVSDYATPINLNSTPVDLNNGVGQIGDTNILSRMATPNGIPLAEQMGTEDKGLGAEGGGGQPAAGDGSEAVIADTVVDNRLRLSALRGQDGDVYGPNDKSGNILSPLYWTDGMMFPYTPTVNVSGDTEWQSHSLTHTNYDIHSYQRTPSATISISGKFTVQNQREGEYALACIHFLRTVGKMYYGEQDSASYTPETRQQNDSKAGLPPPVLRLRGYGAYMFNDLRCVLKNYSFNFEESSDYVTVNVGGMDVMLPSLFTISVSVLLQASPRRLREDFKLDDFRTGALMRSGVGRGGWF